MVTMPARSEAAVFVDAENHADLQVHALIRQLRQFDIVERHAYADWRNWRLDRLAGHLSRAGFQLHHAWSGRFLGASKDTADGYMVRGIWRIVTIHPKIATIVIVSGDGFFIQVTRELQERGKDVIVAADSGRVNKQLRSLASQYLPLGEVRCWFPNQYLPNAPSKVQGGQK